MTTQTGCPKCGGKWKKQSGFFICSDCNHRLGSQYHTSFVIINCNPLAPVDEYEHENPIGREPGRRTPLNFEDK
jgi:hypothetical protein